VKLISSADPQIPLEKDDGRHMLKRFGRSKTALIVNPSKFKQNSLTNFILKENE